MDTREKYAVIGAGPAGIAGARNLKRFDIPFDGFEAHRDVGGLWDINNPRSTVYSSAHLISSKKMTEFRDYPMPDEVADYPHHTEVCAYFRSVAKEFGLYEHYRFGTVVKKIEPVEHLWKVTTDGGETFFYKGVIIANGTLSEPNIPRFPGEFAGELLHAARYKSPAIFEGKRVLIVGAGNSGCDIAVDAAHRAKATAISVRRGYHFVPKYILGRPADTVGGAIRLPAPLKQKIDSFILKLFTGDPVRFGFPKPDHKLYESHPIVNSLILYHIGHGDITVKADIERFDGKKARFVDGSEAEFDLVLLATGYKLNYPFIDRQYLNWEGSAPALYLNIFHPNFDNLFILGMIEASGIGWQGRDEQAELVARFILACQKGTENAERFRQLKRGPAPDMSGGFNYLRVERMAYYVHKDSYRSAVRRSIELLG